MADERLRAASARYTQLYNDWSIIDGNAKSAETIARERRAGADAAWTKVLEARDELVQLAKETEPSTEMPK